MTITRKLCLFAAGASLAIGGTAPAHAQASEPFLGQLMTFAGNFCPRGWAAANGALLSISANSALFSLLGTQYGGDGRATFALPDLRGRVVIGPGHGPGLSPRRIGERGGAEAVALTEQQMPAHTHTATLRGADQPSTEDNPANAYLADFPDEQTIYGTGPANVNMGTGSVVVGNAGGSGTHQNMQPFQAITVCIALQGIFPSRS